MDLTAEFWEPVFTVVALLFALVSGTNDGATLLALGARASRMPLLGATLILTVAVVVAPLVLGTSVASTFLDRLVSFGSQLRPALLVAVTASLATIALLGWRGLPTSLTVALLGGLVGVGVGQGLEVHWRTVGVVILIALATPAIGLIMAFLINRIALSLDVRGRVSRLLERVHVAVFSVQCLAYGTNDGQKMLAVFVAATGATGAEAVVSDPRSLLIGLFFALGTLLGLRRYAKSVVLDVFPVRPANAVAAEIGAAVSVLGTGLLGSPVSTTQTVVTSVIGSGMHEGVRRVRWEHALQIGLAWVYTFPMTFSLGVAFAIVWGWVS
ncbi:MAG: inorganic phosphate transporter [Acidimicrobiia bacterium]|nr:inorganic phosphate transporter [Acidimicrobiia bacterium]